MNGTLGIGFILGSLIMGPIDGRGAQVIDAQSRQLNLMVCDKSKAGSKTQEAAKETTIRIFGNAGIDLRWIDLPNSNCMLPEKAKGFTVVIAPESPKGWASSDSMGFAPGETGDHPRAYIFLDLVKEFMGRFEPSGDSPKHLGIMVGYAIAHELGHLLIPGASHTHIGIMSTRWTHSQWRDAIAGSLWFAPDHVAIMRHRLGGK